MNGPQGTEDLAFAYGNRSAALYRLGLYQVICLKRMLKDFLTYLFIQLFSSYLYNKYE